MRIKFASYAALTFFVAISVSYICVLFIVNHKEDPKLTYSITQYEDILGNYFDVKLTKRSRSNHPCEYVVYLNDNHGISQNISLCQIDTLIENNSLDQYCLSIKEHFDLSSFIYPVIINSLNKMSLNNEYLINVKFDNLNKEYSLQDYQNNSILDYIRSDNFNGLLMVRILFEHSEISASLDLDEINQTILNDLILYFNGKDDMNIAVYSSYTSELNHYSEPNLHLDFSNIKSEFYPYMKNCNNKQ